MFENLPELVVAGVPVILIILALVEEVKAYGLSGKILRFVSLLIGFLMSFLVTVGVSGVPTDVNGWVSVSVVGLIYGLSASGGYDFLNSRIRKVA